MCRRFPHSDSQRKQTQIVLHQLIRNQCWPRATNEDVYDFIKDNNLITERTWPAYSAVLTHQGAAFLRQQFDSADQ